jgi:hypothetical protein
MKIAIVGLGKAAWGYDLESPVFRQSHTQSIIENSKFKLVGGVDIDAKIAKSWEEHFERPSFLSLDEMLKICKPDLVVLTVPIDSLYLSLTSVLTRKPSTLIIVEKPVVTSWDQYIELKKLDRGISDRVLVNLPRLFAPESLELSGLINSHLMERLEFNGSYSGALNNTSLHFISLIDFLVPDLKWSCDNSGDFEVLRETDRGSTLFGHVIRTPNSKLSTFGFNLSSESLNVNYLDGGNEINVIDGKQLLLLNTTRDIYQRNVYDYVASHGFDEAISVSGLNQILPSIEGMLSNYG